MYTQILYCLSTFCLFVSTHSFLQHSPLLLILNLNSSYHILNCPLLYHTPEKQSLFCFYTYRHISTAGFGCYTSNVFMYLFLIILTMVLCTWSFRSSETTVFSICNNRIFFPILYHCTICM